MEVEHVLGRFTPQKALTIPVIAGQHVRCQRSSPKCLSQKRQSCIVPPVALFLYLADVFTALHTIFDVAQQKPGEVTLAVEANISLRYDA